MPFIFTSKGSFKNTERFLKKLTDTNGIFSQLDTYGQLGVQALASATPVNSGITASSWYYEIERSEDKYSITWKNSNTVNGFPVAIMLQYGHGTGTGGYVYGQDYINPAIKPVFDQIEAEVWRVVTSA